MIPGADEPVSFETHIKPMSRPSRKKTTSLSDKKIATRSKGWLDGRRTRVSGEKLAGAVPPIGQQASHQDDVVDGIDMAAIARQRRNAGTPEAELDGMSWAA